MTSFWLRCDNCNRSLGEAVAQSMQLVIRFRPESFPWALPKLNSKEYRARCRNCGWVSIFTPAENTPLQSDWRAVTLKKQA